MKPITLAVAVLVATSAFCQNYNITYLSKVEFPGQTCANIWGYAANGKEYALVGASDGLVIVDVTDPSNPVQLEQITDGISSLWREIKSYGAYAYITSEGLDGDGKGGLGIADLSGLPATPVPFHKYHGDGAINDNLKKVHALDVDEVEGYVYLYGADVISPKGIVALNLNSDPYNPIYVGQYNGSYVHDGYSNNGMVYGSHIFAGYFSIIDFTNKANPVVTATQTTPNAFTHNTWLSTDGNYLFSTDEKSNSYLAAYDISDPTDIVEMDRIRTTPGSGSIIHNTYITDHFAVTSWYKDGVTITDTDRPGNLIQVGYYDTYSGSGNGFNGAWGVYPYLPSQTMLVTNIEEPVSGGGNGGVLYILAPTFVNACYLEGNIKDASNNNNLAGVNVKIEHTDPLNYTDSGLDGNYGTGQPTPGTFDVTFTLANYETKVVQATLNSGIVTTLDVELEPSNFNPLPLEMLVFTAESAAEYNLLEWTTAQEKDVDYFEIQRKRSADDEWRHIGNVAAVGNSAVEIDYSFYDEIPAPEAHYRIRTLDLDGQEYYSNVIVVTRPKEGFYIENVYPIPSSGMIRLEIQSDKYRPSNLSIFDVSGSANIQQTLFIEPGLNYQMVELPDDWPDGVYWLTLSNRNITNKASIVLRR